MGRIKSYLNNVKVAVLTVIVILAFIFSSIGWRHIESSETTRLIIGACILLIMYILMIFELVNRNLAALIGAAVAVAAYDCLVDYAEMDEILSWEDLETLTLLFGMMVIVSLMRTSGLFNFLAIWAYKKSGGHFWLLIISMSIITALLSAFIDNVSTMLLMSPTLIKLSELEHIDPKYVLLIMVAFCNIGGCATPVGDPPNLIIIGSPLINSLDINFGSFVCYCGPCVIFTMAVIYVYLKLVYKSKESFRPAKHLQQQQRNLSTTSLPLSHIDPNNNNNNNNNNGKDAAHFVNLCASDNSQQVSAVQQKPFGRENELASLSKELDALRNCLQKLEDTRDVAQLSRNTLKLKHLLEDQIDEIEDDISQVKQQGNLRVAPEARRGSRLTVGEIKELMHTYSIKSWPVLIMSMSVLVAAVCLFFVQAVPHIKLSLGWVSLFAALVLLVVSSTTHLPVDDAEEEEERRSNGGGSISAGSSHEQVQVIGGGGGGGHTSAEENFNRVIAGVEWSTLMFFFALFIVMEVMVKLGVIQFLGTQITSLVDHVPAGDLRVAAGITIILWSSGVASAFIDNVPFTTMMIKILETMVVQARASEQPDLLSIKALVFALAFGACYGGNGTIIGASANLVTVGVASNYGYPITFNQFLRFNGPITVISLAIANVYLILVFVVFGF